MTTSDLQLLRFYVSDPSGSGEVFSSSVLQDILDRSDGDIKKAAAELWSIKAATVHDWYQINMDGDFLSREQVWEHCKAMEEMFREKSSSSLVSVQLTTNTEDESLDSWEV